MTRKQEINIKQWIWHVIIKYFWLLFLSFQTVYDQWCFTRNCYLASTFPLSDQCIFNTVLFHYICTTVHLDLYGLVTVLTEGLTFLTSAMFWGFFECAVQPTIPMSVGKTISRFGFTKFLSNAELCVTSKRMLVSSGVPLRALWPQKLQRSAWMIRAILWRILCKTFSMGLLLCISFMSSNMNSASWMVVTSL